MSGKVCMNLSRVPVPQHASRYIHGVVDYFLEVNMQGEEKAKERHKTGQSQVAMGCRIDLASVHVPIRAIRKLVLAMQFQKIGARITLRKQGYLQYTYKKIGARITAKKSGSGITVKGGGVLAVQSNKTGVCITLKDIGTRITGWKCICLYVF